MVSNNDAQVGLKPLKDIINCEDPMKSKSFFIPRYQRGYRWEKEQIEDLLKDLVEFYKEIENKKKNGTETEEVYCLQPLVVKYDEKNNRYDVIDGQQRLTTLTILLRCFGCYYKYSLEYETRQSSKDFIENIMKKSENDAADNADFYYMFKARNAIQGFFEDENHKNLPASFIQDSFIEAIKKRVSFVWYELAPEEDSVKVFKRLNIGKISLTESELIKALFLNSNNFILTKSERSKLLSLVEMANEWDQIEYRLQDDRFWLFFHDTEYKKPTRIDYILDLVREYSEGGDKYTSATHTYPTFTFFYDGFSNASNKQEYLDNVWEKVYEYYSVLEEWYNDDILYHYIGYLCIVDNKKGKNDSPGDIIYELLMEWKKGRDKDEFKKELKKRIKRSVSACKNLERKYVSEKGEDKKGEARPLLLLHNILTVINQNLNLEYSKKYNLPDFHRFPFHLFKKESWDVEHIRPNNLQEFEGEKKQNLRAKYVFVQYKYHKEKKVETAYKEYMSCYKTKKGEVEAFDKFINVIEDIEGKTGRDELSGNVKNQIWNYVLLDASTNREYGNSCYAIKRDFIMQKQRGIKPRLEIKKIVSETDNDDEIVTYHEENEVAFVPICTANVFSKSYSTYPDNLRIWSKSDAEEYKYNIHEVCKEFLK